MVASEDSAAVWARAPSIPYSTPFDRAESGAPEQDIHEANGFDRLVTELHGRIMGVPV